MARRWCPGWVSGAVLGWSGISAAEEPRPGVALSPEATHFEGQLRQPDDTVERRRQFDEQLVHLGLLYGLANAMPRLAAYAEVNVLDRLAIGSELGATFWGFAGGAYLLARPLVWSGLGRSPLHAFTLQATYRYMQFGDELELFGFCHTDCDRSRYVTTPAHFATFEAGFQHSFFGGWSLRYSFGATTLLHQPDWHCTAAGAPAECGDETPPSSTSFSASLIASHAIVF